jgi:protein SCO1
MRAVPAAIAVTAIGLALSACGSSSGSTSSDPAKPHYQAAVASPQRPAPPLKLDDSLGKPVDIKDYRGKAVLVTFIYDHCPDVCPLIVSHLHTALGELGPQAKKLQIIAVSVDPNGDTAKTVKKFLAAHQMTGKMQYLIGSKSELGKVWRNWGIVARPAKSTPNQVEHSAEIYGITGSGKLTTLYPANFQPRQVVHDVPLLASQ